MNTLGPGSGIWGWLKQVAQFGLETLMGLAFLSTWVSSTKAREQSLGGPGPKLEITIHVHDYARVGRYVLDRAEREATRVLLEAGVQLTWVDCPRAPQDHVEFSACRQPLRPYDKIDVSILSRAMSARAALPATTLALTPMSSEGERASMTSVFLSHVDEQASTVGVGLPILLGHVLAHELGHLLLRTSHHASSGLMRPTWTAKDLRRAAHGQLLFTQEQAASLRAELRARARLSAQFSVAKQ